MAKVGQLKQRLNTVASKVLNQPSGQRARLLSGHSHLSAWLSGSIPNPPCIHVLAAPFDWPFLPGENFNIYERTPDKDLGVALWDLAMEVIQSLRGELSMDEAGDIFNLVRWDPLCFVIIMRAGILCRMLDGKAEPRWSTFTEYAFPVLAITPDCQADCPEYVKTRVLSASRQQWNDFVDLHFKGAMKHGTTD